MDRRTLANNRLWVQQFLQDLKDSLSSGDVLASLSQKKSIEHQYGKHKGDEMCRLFSFLVDMAYKEMTLDSGCQECPFAAGNDCLLWAAENKYRDDWWKSSEIRRQNVETMKKFHTKVFIEAIISAIAIASALLEEKQ